MSGRRQKIWKCEFCYHVNTINLEEDEMPSKEETLDYMLLPPEEKKLSDSEKVIIFCLDISGSMCVTTELSGKLKLRGDKNPELWKSLNQTVPDQWLPGQRRDVTYVSRLQCVQAAIDVQLEKLKKEHPNYKVGLIVFNNEVTVLGDGTNPPLVITGDKLNDFETLLNIGLSNQVVKPIDHCKELLVKKLYELDETGATALGPALVVALGMTQSIPGSTIVLATDGLANTGIGTLDPPSVISTSTLFYDQLTQTAKKNSVSVNILGIRGDSINVNVIGRIADGTSGIIDLVDPGKITENIATILESRLVGTNVSVKLFLHNGFQFPEDEEWKKEKPNSFYVVREVGNAYDDTEITAEFKPKSAEEIYELLFKEKSPTGKTEPSKNVLPFQVQIEYTAPSGMKCLRVITRKKEITTDQSEVLKNVDVALLGMHSQHTSAMLAQKGDVLGAMKTAETYQTLIHSNVQTDSEKRAFEKWNLTNRDFFNSPQIMAQQRIQEQQIYSAETSPPPKPNFGYKRNSSTIYPPAAIPPPPVSEFQTSVKPTTASPVMDVGSKPSFGFSGITSTNSQSLMPTSFPQPHTSNFDQLALFNLRTPDPIPQPPVFQHPFMPSKQPPQSPGLQNPLIPSQQPPQSPGFQNPLMPSQKPPQSPAFQNPLMPSQSPGFQLPFMPSQQPPQSPGFQLPFIPSQQPPQSPRFLPPPQPLQSPGFQLPFMPSPQPPQPHLISLSEQSPQYDDDTSNQIYQQKNIRKNKNVWGEERKF